MRIVVFASIILSSLCGASSVLAQEEPESRVSYGMAVASDYMYEDQAYEVPGAVVNGYVSVDLGNGFSADGWAQYGEADESQEVDLTLSWTREVGDVTFTATGGGYFYPTSDLETIYVMSASAEIPMGPVALELGVDRYSGGFDSTVYSAAVSGTVGMVDVFVGRAYNDPEDITPWFARVSVPIGPEESGFRIGARGFWGADEGVALELTKDF